MNYPTDRMQYIDMDRRYRPEVVYFDGMQGLGNIGGFWDTLFGKSQAWYDRLNEIQNRLTVLTAEVSAFGEQVWNAVAKRAAATVGAPPHFPLYKNQMEALQQSIASTIVTRERIPTDAAVDTAAATVKTVESRVNYAKGVAPELAREVERTGAQMAATVEKLELKSPGDVGKQEFLDQLEQRSKALGIGLGISAMAIAGIAIAAILLTSPSKPWRNNPRRRRRTRRGAGPDIQKIALYGGLAYLGYTALFPKKSA